jgi:uncharacterized protein DUF3597
MRVQFLRTIMNAVFGRSPDSASSPPETPSRPASSPPADVTAVLTELASRSSEKLDWQNSIVDLMKLLKLDSSLAARKQLAHELHYDGDRSDTARMNVWLHQQVMNKLAAHGGKVPSGDSWPTIANN